MKKEEVKVNDRKNYITLLSVISAFAVLMLHCNTVNWEYSRERFWLTSNIVFCVFYYAVPIFFMITGANLLDYQDKYSTKVYFLKRIKKVLIPYLFWSLIVIFYFLFSKKNITFSDLSFTYIFNGLSMGSIMPFYWFFAPLFCVYLCIPLFASVEKSKRKKLFTFLLILGFILNAFIPFISKLFELNLANNIFVIVTYNYLLYALAGYMLDKYDLQKRDRILIYILGLIGLLSMFIGTQVLSDREGKIIEIFKGYTNVPCIMYSVSIFVFVKELCKKINIPKLINILSKYTFEFYLMHYFVIDIIRRIFNPNIKSIWYRLPMPFIIMVIVILITWLLRKIPIVKKIVP